MENIISCSHFLLISVQCLVLSVLPQTCYNWEPEGYLNIHFFRLTVPASLPQLSMGIQGTVY